MGVRPRVDSTTFGKLCLVFDALAAESVENGPFSGAAAEKDVASEARNAPVPGGPGASKSRCFQLFLQKPATPWIGKPENVQIVCRPKSAKMVSG